MKKKILTIMIVVVILVVLVGVFLIGFRDSSPEDEALANTQYERWLLNNCECVIKDRLKCPDGFEFIDRRCRNGQGDVTFSLSACSQYNCDGELVTWAQGFWRPEINEELWRK